MIRRYAINERIFSKWSANMAYVLGYIYADGHIQNVPSIRAQYLRITSVDKDRLIFIRKVLQSTHPIVEVPKKHGHYKDKFLLSIGSKTLYKDLLSIGLHPAKSMNMTLPEIPKKHIHHFVRGYFDGDGCLFIERKPSKDRRRTNIHRMSITFTSGSGKFLEQLGDYLLKCGCIQKKKIYRNGDSFQMRFSTKEAIVICRFMYHGASADAYMRRKKAIYDEYAQIRKLPKR